MRQTHFRQAALMEAPDKATLAFLDYLHSHREVYDAFKRIACQLYAAGIRHYGAKAIMEVVRFQTAVSARGQGEPFKVNNSHVSRMARHLAAEDERFAQGFFEFRVLRTPKGRAA